MENNKIELPEMLSDEAIKEIAGKRTVSMVEWHTANNIYIEAATAIRDLLLLLIASKEEEIKELKDILQGITDSFNPQMRNALTNRQTDAIEDARQYFLTNQ